MNESATGCRAKNAKEIETNMWRRRKNGEETARPAYFNSSDNP